MSRIRLPSEREMFDSLQSEGCRRIRVVPFVASVLCGRLVVEPEVISEVQYHRNERITALPRDLIRLSSAQESQDPSEQWSIQDVSHQHESIHDLPQPQHESMLDSTARDDAIIQSGVLTDETFYDARDDIPESEPSPEYKVTLDRQRDVLLFDPRILPILRVNKSLLDMCVPETLSQVMTKLIMNLPHDVDPLTLPQLQDNDYFKHIPELLLRQQLLETRRYEQMQRHHVDTTTTNYLSFRLFDDIRIDLAYALMLSLKELVAVQRTYHGFRYRQAQVR